MQEDHKIAPLDESSSRQILVGWGSGLMCLALGFLIGGIFVPYLGLFAGAAIALRGHVPRLFAKHIDAQLIAGTPYRRQESIKTWSFSIVACLALAGGASWIHRKIVPIPGPPEEPIVHIEPERDIVWSTLPGQRLGMFTLQLHNTGVPIDITEVRLKYFLAQKSSGVIIKRLPDLIDSHKGLLEHDTSSSISIDLNPYMDEIAELSAKEGSSLAGVYIVCTFRRHSDGKDFSLSKPYGLFWVPYGDTKKPKGVALFTEGTNMDEAAPAPLQNSKLTLHEVAPFLPLPERWISITKYITVGPDGKVVASLDRPPTSPASLPSVHKPDLTLRFVIKRNLSFEIVNGTHVEAMNPRYSVAMVNLDSPPNKSLSTNENGTLTMLPNTTEMLNDYVPGDGKVGPFSLGKRWEERGTLSLGDRMFGMASIGCPSCAKIHYYYVYAIHGKDGWYCESTAPLSLMAITENAIKIERSKDDPYAHCPESKRIIVEDITGNIDKL